MIIIHTNLVNVPDFYKKEVVWEGKEVDRQRGQTTIIIK